MNKDEIELDFLADDTLVDFENVPLLKWFVEAGYLTDDTQSDALTDSEVNEF